jgi:hypothetical protein
MKRLALLVLGACASHPPTVEPKPDYGPAAVEPAPPQAELYANCLADAIANHRYGRAHDADTQLLVFTCHGAAASAFFDGLADRSAKQGSEFMSNGVTYRSTVRVRRDLFGVDYCSRDTCNITLNAGDFLR